MFANILNIEARNTIINNPRQPKFESCESQAKLKVVDPTCQGTYNNTICTHMKAHIPEIYLETSGSNGGRLW